MTAFELDPEFAITDEPSLRGLFEATHALAILKCQDTIGEHAREFIRRPPFLCIGTQNLMGSADVSPRGDPAGFVKILDERTLAIPDRPGNNRLDTLTNIIANPSVGLLFVIPGFDDTLRELRQGISAVAFVEPGSFSGSLRDAVAHQNHP